MARYAYVNGRYVDHRDASVHIEDRGYQLADGVYEVVGVRDGKMIDEVPHIDRLDRSLRELFIGWPVSRPALGFIMRELMRQIGRASCRERVEVAVVGVSIKKREID